jgi:hypothetical protein
MSVKHAGSIDVLVWTGTLYLASRQDHCGFRNPSLQGLVLHFVVTGPKPYSLVAGQISWRQIPQAIAKPASPHQPSVSAQIPRPNRILPRYFAVMVKVFRGRDGSSSRHDLAARKHKVGL